MQVSANNSIAANPALPLTGGRGVRRFNDLLFAIGVLVAAVAIPVLMVLMLFILLQSAQLSIAKFGLGFFWGTNWDPVKQEFGALPFIYGTIVSSIIALVIGGPIALGSAICLTEMAPGWLREPVALLVELLAAIPSVVYGLWGIFVLVPILRTAIQPTIGQTLGWLPLFGGPAYGVGMLAGGLILAIMIIPTIAAVSRDVINVVPPSQREAMLAVGATRWETIWKVVLPYARSGILGGIMLGLGRALGETMAVTMVIGNRPEISASLFAPSYTMASVIANEFTEATYDLYLGALIEIGLVLFLVTLVMNTMARLLVWRAGMAQGGGR
jgi:phosphate transport system permease protein